MHAASNSESCWDYGRSKKTVIAYHDTWIVELQLEEKQ